MKSFRITSVIFLATLLFLSCNNLSSTEDFLIGDWSLSNYTDSQQRTVQEEAEFQESVSGLKIDLTLIEDGTFERSMYQPGVPEPVVNKGEWYLENEDKILTMKVTDSPLSKLLIVELNEQKAVLRVEEEGISTTLTFSRK